MADLEHALDKFRDEKIIRDVGEENTRWIIENHHLWNLNEIAHKRGVSRMAVIRFFHFCGISTEMIYGAGYTTPRMMGEVAGRARENGYIVEGTTLRRNPASWWRANSLLEQQAVGAGYRVFDQFGNELAYHNIRRPGILATESEKEMKVEEMKVEAPKAVELYDTIRVHKAEPKPKHKKEPKPKKDPKPKKEPKPKPKKESGSITMHTVKIKTGRRELTDEQYEEIFKCSKPRTGCIYFEIYNRGHGKIGKRFVAEIMFNYKRYRFRSTNAINAQSWLDNIKAEHGIGANS